MKAVGLLLAAGSGRRLARSLPKALVELGGEPLVLHCMRSMAECGLLDSVVVVAPPDYLGWAGWSTLGGELPVAAVVPGGESRQQSVRSGLGALSADTTLVVCHDAARPFAGPELFARVIEAMKRSDRPHGAVPVIPSPDTVKRVRGGRVLETLPRAELALAQTPQAFLVSPLMEAHGAAAAQGVEATDDAMLLERAGYRVVAVEGEPSNLKITSPEDLDRAETWLRGRLSARGTGGG